MVEYEEDGRKYMGLRKLRLDFFFGYGNHRYAGVAGNDGGGPKPGWADSHLSFDVADPDKMARGNNPGVTQRILPSRRIQNRRSGCRYR